MCLTMYQWAEFRQSKSGIKVYLRLRVHDDGVIPDKMVMTAAKPSDRTQMDAMIVVEDENAINVFNRGYIDYQQFDHGCKKRFLFVTRLKENATVEVMTELGVKANGPIIF